MTFVIHGRRTPCRKRVGPRKNSISPGRKPNTSPRRGRLTKRGPPSRRGKPARRSAVARYVHPNRAFAPLGPDQRTLGVRCCSRAGGQGFPCPSLFRRRHFRETFLRKFFTDKPNHGMMIPLLDERRCQVARRKAAACASHGQNGREASKGRGSRDTRGMKGWRPSAIPKARNRFGPFAGEFYAGHRIDRPVFIREVSVPGIRGS